MEYLIDTHIFLWSLLDTSKLKPHVIKILENEENKIYLSSISFWEIALKNQNKKLDLKGISVLQLPHIAQQFNYTILNLSPYDYVSIGQIPLKENHKNPFDRILIQTAIRNNLVLISNNAKFQQYKENGLQLLWE